MKSIKVVAAIIKSADKNGEPIVFATQRGYGDYKDWWEFPGGKLEKGETPEEALVREIHEELTAGITVDRYLTTVEYDYPNFHLSMDCFWCRLAEGKLTLLEHEAAKWLPLHNLRQVRHCTQITSDNLCSLFFREQGRKRSCTGVQRGFLTQLSEK